MSKKYTTQEIIDLIRYHSENGYPLNLNEIFKEIYEDTIKDLLTTRGSLSSIIGKAPKSVYHEPVLLTLKKDE